MTADYCLTATHNA